MEEIDQLHAPGISPLRKEFLVLIWWEAGWAPEPVWMWM